MKTSMIVAAFAAIAGAVAALPGAIAAPAASVSRRIPTTLPIKLTVVNQSPQAIHTNPQDGWEGDLQPGESKDFHSTGLYNMKEVIITNYPAPQDGVYCKVKAWNPSIGKPSMFASCYNAQNEAVVSDWSYTKASEGTCGYVTDSAGHIYADYCRESDVDGYKHFTYYVYGN